KLDKNCNYTGLAVESNEGEEKYLYKREKGGLPGKFITGRIGSIDVKNLKKDLQNVTQRENVSTQSLDKPNVSYERIDRFQKNKIAWIRKSGILKNRESIKKIPEDNARLLKSVTDEIISKQDKIMKDFSDKILNGEYGEILLTVKID